MTRSLISIRIWLVVLAICSGGLSQADKARKVTDPAAALQRKIHKPRINTTFKKAVGKCATLSGATIEVDWTSIEATGVKPSTRIKIRIPEATVEQLLELTLAQAAAPRHPLAWRIVNNVVRVTTQIRAVSGRIPRGRRPAAVRGTATSRPAPRPSRFRSIEFDHTGLSDVIEFFRSQTGLNFHVNWRSLEVSGIDRSTEITLKVSGISLARALELITNDISGTRDKFGRVWWTIDEGLIKIATGSAMDTDLRVRIFDVSDLLMSVPNFTATQLTLSNSSSSGSGSSGGEGLFGTQRTDTGKQDTSTQGRQRLEADLIEIIKNTIGQDMWQPIGKGSAKIVRGRLVISQTLLGFTLLERAGAL